MKYLPSRCGLGLKPQHFDTILSKKPDIGWFEIHPENYMGEGGPLHAYLERICQDYPLSMHGVGMSLGSADGVSADHLEKLKHLVERYQPAQISEHLSWSHWNEIFLNDLLPLPYTQESMDVVCRNIDTVQHSLNRQILIENPSTYLGFQQNDYSEPEFFSLICEKTHCSILLDVNNIYVSAHNNGFDPYVYISDFSLERVQEIHLAGHSVTELTKNKQIRIDDHGSPVKPEVWKLFEYTLSKADREIPTLIEWDTDIPEFEVFENESKKADAFLNKLLKKRSGLEVPK